MSIDDDIDSDIDIGPTVTLTDIGGYTDDDDGDDDDDDSDVVDGNIHNIDGESWREYWHLTESWKHWRRRRR